MTNSVPYGLMHMHHHIWDDLALWSCDTGNLELLDMLLQYRPSNIVPSQYRSMLYQAREMKRQSVVDRLLQEPDIKALDQLQQAIKQGDLAAVKQHLSDPQVRVEQSDFLMYASDCNQTEVIKLLLEDGRDDPNDTDCQALEIAIEHQNYQMAQRLLEDSRVEPDDEMLCIASRQGDLEMVKLLLQSDELDPSDALAAAIRSKQLTVAEALLADSRTRPSIKAVKLAYQQGATKLVEQLLGVRE